MEGTNFCGQNITIDCPEIQVTPLPSLDFQLWFIDSLAEILDKSKQPLLKPFFFERDSMATQQVVIVPITISNLEKLESSKSFGIRLDLYNNEEKTAKAYSILLAMAKVIINVVEVLAKRKSFRYEARLTIANSGQAALVLEITKTV